MENVHPKEIISQQQKFEIRHLTAEDIDNLKPILNQSIVDSETAEPITEEIENVLKDMLGSIDGTNNKQYLVAHDSNDLAVGIMGIDIPAERLKSLAETENPLELINAFIDPQHRGAGIGKILVKGLEDIARSKGASEILVSSGPRYEKTGWGFWSSIYGEPQAKMDDYYGPGRDAPVWKKLI